MAVLKVISLLVLLCSLGDLALGRRSKKLVCEHGGMEGKTEPFFKLKEPMLLNLPCRYKMANVACGGDQTEIVLEKVVDSRYDNNVYMTVVTLNISTSNKDGSVSYQTLSIDNLRFQQYEEKKDFSKSPWQYSATGRTDGPLKITGRYDKRAERAEVVVGRLVVLFNNVMSWQRRRHDKPTLEVTCSGADLQAFETYPATVCGGPDNSEEDVQSVAMAMNLDQHHGSEGIRDAFALFTRQTVQQSAPMCVAMQQIVEANTDTVGEGLYDCSDMYNSWNADIRKEMCDGDTDRFQLYLTCLQVVTQSPMTSSQEERCAVLQKAAMQCTRKHDFHLTFQQLLTQADCPMNDTMANPAPEIEMHLQPRIKKVKSVSCKTMDTKRSYWNQFSPGDVTTFFRRNDISIGLPCEYQMANIRCGGVQSKVFATYTFDSEGRVIVDDVRVAISTRHELPPPIGLVIGNHFNGISNSELKDYIKKGKFNRGPWTHARQGGPELQGDNRIFSTYNQDSQTAILTHRNLTVTYRYIDVTMAVREEQDVLTITCNDTDYTAEEGFPLSVCGGPEDDYFSPDELVKAVPADPHHRFYNNDVLILARQPRTQEDPLCEEVKRIVNEGKSCLGDALAECFIMYRTSLQEMTYGRCLRQKKMNPFKLYVACLRVLSGSDGSSARDTCDTLTSARDACGGSVEDPHMNLTELIERSGCGMV